MSSAPESSEIWANSRWSLIRLSADRAAPEQRRLALEQLFERYREPIERTLAHHLRNRPGLESNAADVFAHCIAHDVFAKADPAKGRFRQFVQGVVRVYVLELAKRRQRARGSSLDEAAEPSAERHESAVDVERDEERAWALGILEAALQRLGAVRPDDETLLRAHYLAALRRSAADLAGERGVSLETMHRQLSRARSRLQPILVEEITEGIATAEDFEAERAWLERRLIEACPGLYTDV